MNSRYHAPLFSLIALLSLSTTAAAEKAPMSVEALQTEAQVILEATIENIRVVTEPSRFEGFGNWDWGIYLTLTVESIEKGTVEGETLEARCFRIKSRKSAYEYITPGGHDPIPEIGTRVKVYLEKGPSSWEILLPNGIAAISSGASGPESPLPDAKRVTELRALNYTYWLPLEGWLLVVLLGIPVPYCVRWARGRKRTANPTLR